MNVLKPHQKGAVVTLLRNEVSQREIARRRASIARQCASSRWRWRRRLSGRRQIPPLCHRLGERADAKSPTPATDSWAEFATAAAGVCAFGFGVRARSRMDRRASAAGAQRHGHLPGAGLVRTSINPTNQREKRSPRLRFGNDKERESAWRDCRDELRPGIDGVDLDHGTWTWNKTSRDFVYVRYVNMPTASVWAKAHFAGEGFDETSTRLQSMHPDVKREPVTNAGLKR